jgi:site-specific DNA recombinase
LTQSLNKDGVRGKAAIYCRVSSERQRERHTIASQRRILPALAESKGYQVSGYYIDDGVSGESLRHMPELSRLLDDAEQRLFSAVFVIDIDRITRFQREAERALIIDICSEYNILIITPENEYDIDSRSDRLQFGIKGAVALYEKQTIRDRCRRGIAEKRAQGQWMGGTPPAGYIYDRNKRQLVIDPVKSEDVRLVMQLAPTKTPRYIARQLNGYSPRMIRRILERHRLIFYSGRIELEPNEFIDAKWPALISTEKVDIIMKGKKARNARGNKSTQANHLLTGLGILRCGYCGRSMKAWHDRKIRKSGVIYDRAYYRCVSISDVSGPCNESKMIPADDLQSKILNNLVKTIGDKKTLAAAIDAANKGDDTQKQADRVKKVLKDLEDRKQRLINAVESGALGVDDIKSRIDEIKEDITATTAALIRLGDTAPKWSENDMDNLPDIDLLTDDFHHLRIVLTHCFEKISVFKNNVYLNYNFPVTSSGKRQKRLKLK